MHRILLIITFICFFNSCEKPIDIELPNEESKLVISSSLISNKYWDNLSQYLYVSNSINGLGTLSDYQYTDSVPVINNANVNIYQLDNTNQITEQYQFNFDENCYCYTHPSFIPLENQTYQLKVVANNFPEITAVETMPSKIDFSISNFEINNILDQHVEGDLCSFNISFQDTPNVQNFYKLKVWAANTHQEKHKSCTYTVNDPSFFIPINASSESNYYNGKNGYFTDELFDGETKTLFIDVEKPAGAYEFFYIQLISLSKKQYLFNLTRKEQNRDSNNFIFNSEPLFIQSNIEGGYGIFGGKAITNKAYVPTFYPTNGWLDY